MAKNKEIIEVKESIKNSSETKTVYHFTSELGKEVISKEIFHKDSETRIYPYQKNGEHKYRNIREIIIKWKDKVVTPRGIGTTLSSYGFTRTIKILAKYLDEVLKIRKIIIDYNDELEPTLTDDELVINNNDFDTIFIGIKSLNDLHTKDSKYNLELMLNKLFKDSIEYPVTNYNEGDIARTISKWDNNIDSLSNVDKINLKELFDKLYLSNEFKADFNSQTIDSIRKTDLEEAIKSFNLNLKLSKDEKNLEAKWHELFRNYNWILSYVTAYPVIFHKDEAYVGGKDINNKDGKFVDFVLRNFTTKNVYLIEIKTHFTSLVSNKPYRGTNVFSVSNELSGAISQVLNQRDTLQKRYASLVLEERDFETFNSRCCVIVGNLTSLDKKKRAAFELIRSNSRDVDIITFDELLDKIVFLSKIINGEN